jgi:hypothetical protein
MLVEEEARRVCLLEGEMGIWKKHAGRDAVVIATDRGVGEVPLVLACCPVVPSAIAGTVFGGSVLESVAALPGHFR